MALRVLHIADSHIGADLPRTARARLPRRGADFVDSYRRLLAQARAWDAHLVIHAGDLFDEPQPGEGAITAATDPLWALATDGIPVVVIPGNHERSALPEVLALSHPNIHVLRTPRAVRLRCGGVDVAVAGFPCIRRQAHAHFADALRATGWESAPAEVRILAVHQTFDGARCGPANFQFRTSEDVLPREAVPRAFDYVAAGHIHRHQVLATEGGPPIVYAGAPDRIAFAEIGELKGAVLATFHGGAPQVEFRAQDVRPMEIVPLDVTGCDRATVEARVMATLAAIAPDAAVQVRLAGQATRGSLRGLNLTQHIRTAHPAMLATVSTRSIEWVPQREALRAGGAAAGSAFDVLDAPATERVAAAAADIGALPNACGTYALYDAAGRLLYVGKALRMRTRVRDHLRGGSGSHYFANWADQVGRIEMRPAGSELEALLVEAELIRRLAPAFNRQMRQWKRYCYLCENGAPYGQLAICSDPVGGRFGFGPLRSRARASGARDALAAYFRLAQCPDDAQAPRALPVGSPARLCARYFAGRCAGPCADRGDAASYAQRIRVRNALLSGEDHSGLAPLQRAWTELEARGGDPFARSAPECERVLRVLRELSGTARMLRRARGLLGGLLCLPGNGASRTLAMVTPSGLHLERCAADAADAGRIVTWARARGSRRWGAARPMLPKPVADALCTAARALEGSEDAWMVATSEELTTMTEERLRAAFTSIAPRAQAGGGVDSGPAARPL